MTLYKFFVFALPALCIHSVQANKWRANSGERPLTRSTTQPLQNDQSQTQTHYKTRRLKRYPCIYLSKDETFDMYVKEPKPDSS